MSFNTLISGTHKKTSRPSVSSSRPSVSSSRPSVSSSRRAARNDATRNDDTLESYDGNKFIIKVFKNVYGSI
jgi:hypothetical protein